MGPRFDERGNFGFGWMSSPGSKELQWGRASMSAETSSHGSPSYRDSCFNGAALR